MDRSTKLSTAEFREAAKLAKELSICVEIIEDGILFRFRPDTGGSEEVTAIATAAPRQDIIPDIKKPRPANPPPVLTPEMLAEEWSCSGRHVRNLIREGKLGYFHLGGKLLRIKRSDVEEFEHRMMEEIEDPAPAENPAEEKLKKLRIRNLINDLK